MIKDHYSTLGLQKGASEDDIKKAYRSLAKQWHPDKNRAPGAEEKFKEIGAAYEILKCPDKRKVWEQDYNVTKTTTETPRSKQKPSGGTNANYHQSNFKTYSSNETGKGTSGRRFSYSYERGPGRTKFSFFFTDSDYDEDINEPQSSRKEKGRKKKTGSRNRRYSYAGQGEKNGRPKWDNDWNGAERANREADGQRGFSFNFGVFNVFNDGDMGFKAFFQTPFDTFFDEAPSFAFSDDEEEFRKARQERTRQWRENSEKFAGEAGDPEWYDWSRGADLGDSYDEDDDRKSTCVYCGQNVDGELLTKHEAKCRVLMGGEYFEGSKMNWRQRHEDFINMLRHTRRASQAEKTPRSTSANSRSDLIRCKHCFRSFNHKVAGRHIQFCEQKMKETGRPSNPLGQGAEARDYMSKNYTAREYAKTIPKPNSRRNSKVEVEVEDLGSDTEADDLNLEPDPGFPDINANGNNKPFMESPYVKTKTGLHTAATPPRKNSNTKRPRSRPNSTNKKSAKIDVNTNPYKAGTGSGKASGNEGCATCQKKYGKNSAKFACSCGAKKAI